MRTVLSGMLVVLATAGCGQTWVVSVPEAPSFGSEQSGPNGPTEDRVECEFMTVLIDYSRHGDIEISARVAHAMAKEFERYGAQVTDTHDDAYWSLMILASHNARHDGYIFSALLTSRNMNEGYDPGVTQFADDEDVQEEDTSKRDPEGEFNEGEPDQEGELEKGEPSEGAPAPPRRIEKIPTLYNGLSYGSYNEIEEQSRAYVAQAYAAVFPAAKQLCDFEISDQQREKALEGQLPGPPEPL